MDEKTVIYTLATVIAAIVSFLVRRELSREKDKEREIQNRIQDKESEIDRLTVENNAYRDELKALREWKDRLFEETLKRREKNGNSNRG